MLLPEQDLIVPRLPHGIQRFKLRDHICTGANHSGKVADKEIGGGQFFENRKQIMHQLDAECVCPIFRFSVQRVPYKGIVSVHLQPQAALAVAGGERKEVQRAKI